MSNSKKEENIERVGAPGQSAVTMPLTPAEAEAFRTKQAIMARIQEIIKDCEGPRRLADELEKLINLAVVRGGAEGDGLSARDCDNLYWPWELMRALRMEPRKRNVN